MPGEICEFDWGTVKLDIGAVDYQKYQMAVFTSAYGNFRYAKLYLGKRSMERLRYPQSQRGFPSIGGIT